MTYEESLEKISSLLRFGMKPGLERVQKLLRLLGDPQNSLKFVHVAGTNGKGSACVLTASTLRASGCKTGLFISPYVTDFCERMQIDGEMIPHDDLAALVEKTYPLVQKMNGEGEEITEFEFITALAMQWFAQKRCDVVVLEVGLGGRLDATNVISVPLVSVIMSISLDHTAILGDTVEKIAFEKCGIIKENGTTVCYLDQPAGALEVIRQTAQERNNRFVLPKLAEIRQLSTDLTGTALSWRGMTLHLPFLGEHQIKNAATALAALSVLQEKGYSITQSSLQEGFAKASFPARLEVLHQNPTVLLDGAHNPGGTAALAEAVKTYLGGKKVVAVMGMLADKDVSSALKNLAGLFSEVITLEPQNPRAMSAEELAEHWKSLGTPAQAVKQPDDALQKALNLAGGEGAVVICGSLYLAGDIRPRALALLKSK